MAVINLTDCFNFNIKLWKFLGIWPSDSLGRCYKYYSRAFLMIIVIFYNLFYTINLFYLPRVLNSFIEELFLYFNEIAILSKVFTFYLMHDNIVEIFISLQNDIFQPSTYNGVKVVENANKFNITYRIILTVISFITCLILLLMPIIAHVVTSAELVLPMSYSFLSEEIKKFIFCPLYFYQSLGLVFHVLYNVSIDTFFVGIIIHTKAQLEILAEKLYNITDELSLEEIGERNGNCRSIIDDDKELISRLNKAIIHYDVISK